MKNLEENCRDRLLTGSAESNVSAQPAVSYRAGEDLQFFARNPKILTVVLPIVVFSSIFGIYVLDLPVAYYCRRFNPDKVVLFGLITDFGHSAWYILGSLLLFLAFKYLYKRKIYSHRALFVFLSVVVSGISADILKFVFGRYRPNMFFEKKMYGFAFFSLSNSVTSFPSGHAACVAALAFSLYLLYPRYKYIYAILALPVILSRVIIGSHFLTDVVVGSCLGILVTTYLGHLFERKGVELVSPFHSF
jgi:membrane-associated phospholipid phosphatase